jgi:hypothetical protein
LSKLLEVTFKGLQTAFPRHYTALEIQSAEEDYLTLRSFCYWALIRISGKTGYVLKEGTAATYSEYERATMSLENARVSSILDWLESEDYEAVSLISRYENALIYRRWPLRFPVELRPMVKLHMILFRWKGRLEVREKDLLLFWDTAGVTVSCDRETCRYTVIRKPETDEGDITE